MTPDPSPQILVTPSLLRRLTSMLYEILPLLAILFMAGLIFITVVRLPQVGPVKLLFQGYLIMVSGCYLTWFWRHGGQTLAMKTWRIRLVNQHNQTLSNRQAILRFLLAIVSIGLAGIGLFWAFFDKDKQFLHDRLAKTKIISADTDTA